MGEPQNDQQRAADIYWQDIAPDGYGLLLQADAEQDEDDGSRFLWLAAFLYFDVARQKIIPPKAARAILDAALQAGYAEIDALSKRLVSGAITPDKWALEMERIIEAVNRAGAAAAQGGWAQLTGADAAFVQARIDRQLEFLRGFLDDIKGGKQKLNGNLLRRARMYGDAGRGAYEDMRGRLHGQSGYDEERRVLGIADHCPDCVDYAAMGWRPIGSLPPIGDSVCRTNCHCGFEYRNKAGEISI